MNWLKKTGYALLTGMATLGVVGMASMVHALDDALKMQEIDGYPNSDLDKDLMLYFRALITGDRDNDKIKLRIIEKFGEGEKLRKALAIVEDLAISSSYYAKDLRQTVLKPAALWDTSFMEAGKTIAQAQDERGK